MKNKDVYIDDFHKKKKNKKKSFDKRPMRSG